MMRSRRTDGARPSRGAREAREILGGDERVNQGWIALGHLLLTQRKANGWSRRYLADICGVDPDTIENAEKAAHVPRPKTLKRLGLALVGALLPDGVPDEAPNEPGEADLPREGGAMPEEGENGDRLVRREVVMVTETWSVRARDAR